MVSASLQKISRNASDTYSDEEIVSRVLSGEKELFELIMRRHNERLFKISRAYLKDGDEAEDVMQEAYVKAYEQLGRFERRSRFSTWLIRILINEALAHMKHQKRFTSIVLGGDGENPGENTFAAPEQDNPDQQVINKELRNALDKVIDDLPDNYRQVYVMREIEHMSVAETSECLNISEVNVKVRLNRAKEMLKKSLGAVYQDAGVYHFNLIRCDRIVTAVLQRVKRY